MDWKYPSSNPSATTLQLCDLGYLISLILGFYMCRTGIVIVPKTHGVIRRMKHDVQDLAIGEFLTSLSIIV